jgi:hypothetical protein
MKHVNTVCGQNTNIFNVKVHAVTTVVYVVHCILSCKSVTGFFLWEVGGGRQKGSYLRLLIDHPRVMRIEEHVFKKYFYFFMLVFGVFLFLFNFYLFPKV